MMKRSIGDGVSSITRQAKRTNVKFWGRVALTLMTVSLVGRAVAAEWFVGKNGDDGNDGMNAAAAFATIQKGVDALKPGDVLTIAPGEYDEAIQREGVGDASKDTLIRAAIPGTVLLRGDVTAPAFKSVEGFRFTYSAVVDNEPVAVLEIDTVSSLIKRSTPLEVDFKPGSYCYDAKTKTLFVSTTDLRSPAEHRYALSVTDRSGLRLDKARRVAIKGLTTTGFYPSKEKMHRFSEHVGGFMLVDPEKCVIRHCVAFLNGNGFCMVGGKGNLVEFCEGYGNGTDFHSPSGNFMRFNSNGDVIRNCRSHDSRWVGFKYYAKCDGPILLKNNVAWNNQGDSYWMKIKPRGKWERAENNVGLGKFHVKNVFNNLVGDRNHFCWEMKNDNVCLADQDLGLDLNREYADPDNLDFRMQATSTLRGAGPNGSDRGPYPFEPVVFYVAPKGSDANDGLSAINAWKTLEHGLSKLKSGDTLYLLEGTYTVAKPVRLGVADGKPVHVRSRGTGVVRVENEFILGQCDSVVFERLNFIGEVNIKRGSDVAFENCRFLSKTVGLNVGKVANLRVEHCEFTGFTDAGVSLQGCEDAFFQGDLFDDRQGAAIRTDAASAVKYSDYNAFSVAGKAWSVKGKTVGLDAVQPKFEKHSRVADPEFKDEDGVPIIANSATFLANAIDAEPVGVSPSVRRRDVRLAGPFVHSVTATTANLEWWTTEESLCEIAWTDSAGETKAKHLFVDGFGTFTLTGLKPGGKYVFDVRSVDPSINPAAYTNYYLKHLEKKTFHPKGIIPKDAKVAFTTVGKSPAAMTYHVAVNGDDDNDGLTCQTAWRTLNHAAAKAVAGDTVLVGEGTYHERVWLRGGGDAKRPVVWKSAPGEKVVLDGRDRTLSVGFEIVGKEHVGIDGFYFRMAKGPGYVSLYESDHAKISRCFMNGQGFGYSPGLVRAWACSDLLVENCVSVSAMGGAVSLYACPNARIEHCVFLRNLISAGVFVNPIGMNVHFNHNVVTDSLMIKRKTQIFEMPEYKVFKQMDNCFFLRSSAKKRENMFYFYRSGGKMTLADLYELSGKNGSIVCDPRFVASLDMRESLGFNKKKGVKVEIFDKLPGKKNLDFFDLYVTRPDLLKKGVGLQPEAFEDFHFNKKIKDEFKE